MSASSIPSSIRNVLPNKRKTRMRVQRIQSIFMDLTENRLTLLGMLIVLGFLVLVIFAPVIAPPQGSHNPYQMNRDYGAMKKPPGTPGHPLGTTENGGDVWYGVVWGARLSIAISIGVVISTTIFGSIMGGIAGYLGGWVDELIMRLTDAMISIPAVVWAIAVVSALGPSFLNIAIGLATMLWGTYARIIRSEVIHVKNEEYVEAARVAGESDVSIFLREVIPNAIPPIFVQSTLYFGKVVLIAASVSFIGLAPRGYAGWGILVSAGQEGLIAGRWWASLIPGFAIFLWAFAWNMIGDGLRDVLDPRSQAE